MCEIRPLHERLCRNYQTVSIDWPGFGSRPRPRHDWRPKIYSDFLSHLTGKILPPLHAVIAAGHAATLPFFTLAPIREYSLWGFNDTEAQHWMPPVLWVAALMILLPALLYAPVHFLLR